MPRESTAGMIGPDHPEFSGFVFKLVANLNPKHRDRVAFVRVVSGRFEKGMKVAHGRCVRGIPALGVVQCKRLMGTGRGRGRVCGCLTRPMREYTHTHTHPKKQTEAAGKPRAGVGALRPGPRDHRGGLPR